MRATYLFVSGRMAPLSVAGYQRIVARAGKAAGFGFLVHSHMLRHSTGYKALPIFPRAAAEHATPAAWLWHKPAIANGLLRLNALP